MTRRSRSRPRLARLGRRRHVAAPRRPRARARVGASSLFTGSGAVGHLGRSGRPQQVGEPHRVGQEHAVELAEPGVSAAASRASPAARPSSARGLGERAGRRRQRRAEAHRAAGGREHADEVDLAADALRPSERLHREQVATRRAAAQEARQQLDQVTGVERDLRPAARASRRRPRSPAATGPSEAAGVGRLELRQAPCRARSPPRRGRAWPASQGVEVDAAPIASIGGQPQIVPAEDLAPPRPSRARRRPMRRCASATASTAPRLSPIQGRRASERRSTDARRADTPRRPASAARSKWGTEARGSPVTTATDPSDQLRCGRSRRLGTSCGRRRTPSIASSTTSVASAGEHRQHDAPRRRPAAAGVRQADLPGQPAQRRRLGRSGAERVAAHGRSSAGWPPAHPSKRPRAGDTTRPER